MISHGKRNLLGVMVNAIDREAAASQIVSAAESRTPFAVSALAVHGVMTGYLDRMHRSRLNRLDLVVPDGQPVRWALNLLYRTRLPERVYGPTLALDVCQEAAKRHLPIYLYGSTTDVLDRMKTALQHRFPELCIAGAEPSRFRTLSFEEKQEVVDRIQASGARITLVGLGCPRQEVWAYEYRDLLSMPIMAVGAAFDFHAGTLPQAPSWMQRRGLEWLYRLKTEPRRLWKRYVLLNPYFVALVALQYFRVRRFSDETSVAPVEISYG